MTTGRQWAGANAAASVSIRLAAATLALAFASIAPAQAAASPTAPTTPEGWRATALADLDAARALLIGQTPIPFDQENPTYGAWLDEGYAIARRLAEQVRDEQGAFYCVARFINGFRDPHINANPVKALPAPRWPGFIAASRSGGAVVTWTDATDPEAPPVGAQILACDDKGLATLAEERVFPFVMNAWLASDRRRAVTRLFLDREIPWAPPPARCRVATTAGERQIELRWRPIPADAEEFWRAYSDASLGPGAPWGVSDLGQGVTWIGVPTFESSKESSPKLDALIRDAAARGPAMRGGRAIVIDLRGNGGGNSMWADRLAEAIFGEGVIRRANGGARRSAVDWRASTENIAYWRAWINATAVRDFGKNSDAVHFAERAIKGMSRALDRTPPLWRAGPKRTSPSGGLTSRRPRGAGPFPAQVYVLSNGTCGSSCLNFADTVLFVPGVRLIGSATSGDGPYMEVRNETLPSGLTSLTFPQKVWRGMGRGPLEAYEPDLAYDGAWDDDSVRAWVMGVIEQGAASPPR